MSAFDFLYAAALDEIMYLGDEGVNRRTKALNVSAPGVTLRITPDMGFPILNLRRIPAKIFIAEQIFYLSGRRDISWLQNHTKIWDDFLESDNKTLRNSYGHRWRYRFGRDQIRELVRLLEKDPTSRQGTVVTWNPGEDGLTNQGLFANVPCLYGFTTHISGGRLHLHNAVRSNDMVLGAPHDIAGFAFLQRLLAAHLGVEVGVYTHTIANAHIYACHYEATRELVRRANTFGFREPVDTYVYQDDLGKAMAGADDLMDELLESVLADFKTFYNPLPSLGRLKIVV